MAAISTLETEIQFIKKKIQSMQVDIEAGHAKSFYNELLEELEAELQEKEAEHVVALSRYQPINIELDELQRIQYEMKKLIGLLDDEAPNPELLNQLVSKYLPRIVIQRETRTVHITFHINHNDTVLYQKTISADWDLNSN